MASKYQKSSLDHVSKPISFLCSQNITADLKRPIRTMDDVRGYFLWPPHGTTSTKVIINQNKKFRFFKSKENLHNNEDGPDCTVSNFKFSSVTLHILH